MFDQMPHQSVTTTKKGVETKITKDEEEKKNKKYTPSTNSFFLSLNYYSFTNNHVNTLLTTEVNLAYIGLSAQLTRIQDKVSYPWGHRIELNTAQAIKKDNFDITRLNIFLDIET